MRSSKNVRRPGRHGASPMLDHVGITVADFARSLAFYRLALAPLGIDVAMEVDPSLTGGSALQEIDEI